MSIDERIISEAILTTYFEKFKSSLDLDVAIVGAGPAGLTAAYLLARDGYNVAIFERKLSVGGGMWGGGMTWNMIVVQEEGKRILEEIGLTCNLYQEGYYTVDAVAAVTTLASKACLAGAKVFNCMTVEDVEIRTVDDAPRVTGLVVNSSPVELAGLHVDPLVVHAKHVIESTGHALEVLKTLVRKNNVSLNTPSGTIEGERSMWADVAETTTLENTGEAFPGIWVAGMAANACYGSYRMGPIFGGMLLSGEKVAGQIKEYDRKRR
ncbi:sulfide-dependent adenosine diphosphate thiazole synthase [Candidatus Latescibacterota bacterium]